MTSLPTAVLSVLAPAVNAARAALRRLESTEIPAALRRVASYSGGRLPPPLAQRLIGHLEEDSWLRDKAAQELPEGDEREPGRLFLERPEGWFRDLAAQIAAEAASHERRERERTEDRVTALEERLAQARRRAAAKSDGSSDAEEQRRQLGELRDRLGAHQRRADRQADALRREAAALEEQLAAARESLEDAAGEMARLRADLRQARRARAAAERRAAGAAAGGGAAVVEDALALARRLDTMAATARPSPAGEPPRAVVRSALRLPDGIRPDTAGAIDWLTGREEPTLLLVDGYNLSFHLDEREATSHRARDRVNHDAARLATTARSLRVVVVYDSSVGGDGGPTRGPAGVDVVFAAAGLPADDEIVSRAGATDLPVVVISSDREVREAAEQAGALALWSEALAGWMRRRS